MTTQISVETLSPITYNHTPVITTELLAHLYGADVNSIQQNHKRNSVRFIEGKHFFKAVGEELKNLRLTVSQLQISPKTRSLILWTERGAARHAKMLETDQAWEVFERLEDCYFSQKQPPARYEKMFEGNDCMLLIHFDEHGNIEFTEKVPEGSCVCKPETFKHWMERNG